MHKTLYLLLLLSSLVLAEQCETIQWQSPWPVQQYHLANGLRVVLVPQEEASSVFLRIQVNVGSRDEQEGQSGFAHLFEHMMFKGSVGLKDGDYARVISAGGGSHNARTDFDHTSYFAEVSPEMLEQLFWLENKRFTAMDIDQRRFNNQIQAVLEEKAMRIDNKPYIKPGAEFFVEQLKATPYGHMVIGAEADLRAASLEDVQAFFERYYVANNMVLVLVGLFEVEQAKGFIEQYFSTLKSGRTNDRKAFLSPKQISVHKRYVDPLVPFPAYAIAWHTPGKVNEDFRKVEMVNKLILHEDDSRLKNKMEIADKLVFASYSFPATFENIGIANLGFIPRSYIDLGDIKKIVRSELDEIRQNGFSEEELCRSIVSQQSQLLDQYSERYTLSKVLADRVLRGQSAIGYDNELHGYAELNLAQLNHVANQYFTEQAMVLEIQPTVGKRFLKSVMEILPRSWSKKLEKKVVE